MDGLAAGIASQVTAGLSNRARDLYGEIATRNHSGAAYTVGQLVGAGVSVGLGFGNPCAVSTYFSGAYKGLSALDAAGNAINAVSAAQEGDYVGAALGLLGSVGSLGDVFKSCFAAGTPLRTPEGSRPIEEFRAGDLVLSRDERDPAAPVTVRRVEEVFASEAFLRVLTVAGREIRTTAEHPFRVRDKGWTAANLLRAGDEVAGESGGWLTVDGVRDTGEFAAVFNMRIAEDATYFVGGAGWGFAVWAHDSCDGPFVIIDWSGFPSKVKPPYGAEMELIAGQAYDQAVQAKKQINNALHKAYLYLQVFDMREQIPVKFGGSPTDIANKMPLYPSIHHDLVQQAST